MRVQNFEKPDPDQSHFAISAVA